MLRMTMSHDHGIWNAFAIIEITTQEYSRVAVWHMCGKLGSLCVVVSGCQLQDSRYRAFDCKVSLLH